MKNDLPKNEPAALTYRLNGSTSMRPLILAEGGKTAMRAIRRLFAPREAVEAGRRLYAAAAAHARQPGLYLEAGAPDTPEGRFELYTLHVVLILHRLKGQGPQAAETGQALFNAYVSSLDGALRDLGVGDLSVGKKMRKLGEAFYGRAKSYDEALARLPATDEVEALIARTVFADVKGDAAGLAAYVARSAEALAAQPLEAVLASDLAWPDYDGSAA